MTRCCQLAVLSPQSLQFHARHKRAHLEGLEAQDREESVVHLFAHDSSTPSTNCLDVLSLEMSTRPKVYAIFSSTTYNLNVLTKLRERMIGSSRTNEELVLTTVICQRHR